MGSHLSTLCDDDGELRLVVGSCRHILNLSHDQQTINQFSKHDVFPIQPVAFSAGNEKLAPISSWTTVRHGEQARYEVFQFEVFVRKRSSVDAAYAGAVAIDKVSSLYHKVFDHPVECAALETDWDAVLPELSGAELSKILCRLWNNVRKKLKLHPSHLLPSNCNVKEDDRVVGVCRLERHIDPALPNSKYIYTSVGDM